MHLSHIDEELETWYQHFDFDERVDTTVPAGAATCARGTQTVPQAPARRRESRAESRELRSASDRSATARRSRPPRACRPDIVAADGTVYRKGTAIPHRADFNTLDNPFFWSVDPSATG